MQIGQNPMKNSVKFYAQNNRIKWLYLLGFVFLGVAGLLGIILGSTPLSLSEIVDAFREGFIPFFNSFGCSIYNNAPQYPVYFGKDKRMGFGIIGQRSLCH